MPATPVDRRWGTHLRRTSARVAGWELRGNIRAAIGSGDVLTVVAVGVDY